MKVARVTNEKKNLNRLAGEFLVASRLTQRGYMVTLQWGTTIGYDILVFDKAGNVAFLEVKSSAQYSRRWILQKKYAEPNTEAIPLERRQLTQDRGLQTIASQRRLCRHLSRTCRQT